MDNLVKAMYCSLYECDGLCDKCMYNQSEYIPCEPVALMYKAIERITSLQKSNRNWHRKAQRLRKKMKEKENV